jgi:hypothetical protein
VNQSRKKIDVSSANRFDALEFVELHVRKELERRKARSAVRVAENTEAVSKALDRLSQVLGLFPDPTPIILGDQQANRLDYRPAADALCKAAAELTKLRPGWQHVLLPNGPEVRVLAVKLLQNEVESSKVDQLCVIFATAAPANKFSSLGRRLCDDLPREAFGWKLSSGLLRDGPTGRGTFVYRGKQTVKLTNNVYKFLAELWPEGAETHLGEVQVRKIGPRVWGEEWFDKDQKKQMNGLSKLLGQVRRALSDAKIRAGVVPVKGNGSRKFVAFRFEPHDPVN